MLLFCGLAIIAALACMQRRLDSSIIEPKTEPNPEQKNMTATRHTRHDMRTLNAHPAASPLRSQGSSAGAFA
ncbi:hypothetical protein AKG95_09175 [Janthinobacterium lividum]|uniref:Uncharacterized protein n=1 Tax=Janthinobacterium lividum TaxID=29581 RepID=A0A1S1UC85_9BURK|nr:hypothetical protein AKG95_09175 [Janthinobacterium lividum]